MTFRVRTALVVLALTALTMGCAFAAVWERFVSAQRDQLDSALISVARREAAEAAAGQLEFTDAPGPSANAVGPLPKYGVLYGLNGGVLATTNNFTEVPRMPYSVPYDTGFDFEHEGVPMRGVVVGVASTGRRVLLATPRLDFEDDARILARAMAITFGVGCLWAAVVAFGVATRLTREHRIVADAARRVASGDTTARVAFRSSDADLRQLATDVNAMIEQLVGLLSVQERFIAHAAHELRTPLTSLRIELEHALRNGVDKHDYESALRGALDSARRLSDLAEDLLQLARLKAEHIDAEDFTALEDALADAVADVAPVGRLRDVFIITEPVSALVHADRRGLARLFRNILENAVRFSPRGGRVRVETRVEEDRVVIGVADEGVGIKPDDEERIFEAFTRGGLIRGPRAARSGGVHDHNQNARDDDGGPGGSGLGLAIARGLARGFGGDVTAKHCGSGGGHFSIVLNRRRSSPS
jgi:two-component system OmpR family sensor kinase